MQIFSKKIGMNPAAVIALMLLVGCALLSVLIPPLKSPDEPDHIERAYLLSKGVWVLDHPDGKSSGGNIDTGLLDYIANYPPEQDKVSMETVESADAVRWSKERVYDPSPGTGYYFPVIYSPQAMGLALGEWLDLTVDHSYKLAKALSLLASILLVGFAFRIYEPNALTLALLAMPMNLFQLASASLDGVSTALAVFAISVFLRIATDKKESPVWTHYALAIAVVVLVTSRIHALPFVLLLFASWRYARHNRLLLLLAISSFMIAFWTGLAIKTTIDMRVAISAPTSQVVAFYLQQPLQFIQVVWATISDTDIRQMYVRSFIGVLGWLDTPFNQAVYSWLTVGLLLMTALTFSWRGIRDEWQHRLLLACVALASMALIFLALLVTWTPHPAHKIAGVQGRYFLIPAIVLAYSIAGRQGLLGSWQRPSIVAVGCMYFVFSLTATTQLLLKRYYLSSAQQPLEQVTYDPNPSTAHERKRLASAPLNERSPIHLSLPPISSMEMGKLRRIGILFGTHARQNLGKAQLLLRTQDGRTFIQVFALSNLADNSDRFFNIPADHYVDGEIRFLTGGGISVWESHSTGDQKLTCMKLFYTFNKTVVVAGCP
jgi:uncharacterized membrane protein